MSRYFLDESFYFITVPTFKHCRFFEADQKRFVLDRILEAEKRFDLINVDFGIMSDHYHMLANFGSAQRIPKLMQFINGGAAFQLKKIQKIETPIWDEYHLYVSQSEYVLGRIRGYVMGNPIKHAEVESFKKLENYPYSSFG